MTLVAALIGAILAVFGVVVIEKKRKEGPLTYPLWRGNLFIPWVMFVGLFAVLVGSVNLPRFIQLAERAMPTQAIILALEKEGHCTVRYRYTVQGKDYTPTDSKCGIKEGEHITAYFDPESPDLSTLYLPAQALHNELIAMALICLCLPTLLVLWLMMTHVIGRPKKP